MIIGDEISLSTETLKDDNARGIANKTFDKLTKGIVTSIGALMLYNSPAQAGIVDEAKKNPDSKIVIKGCTNDGTWEDISEELRKISYTLRKQGIPRQQIEKHIENGKCDTSIHLEEPFDD